MGNAYKNNTELVKRKKLRFLSINMGTPFSKEKTYLPISTTDF